MESYFSRSVIDRAIKTAIQFLIIGLFGVDIGEAISNSSWPDVTGWQSIGMAVMGAVLSVVMNLVLGKFGAKWTPNVLASRDDPRQIAADPNTDATAPGYNVAEVNTPPRASERHREGGPQEPTRRDGL